MVVAAGYLPQNELADRLEQETDLEVFHVGDSKKVRQIYDVFEARVRKNGYCGLRMTANVRRKNLFKLLSQHGFKSHSDLKHYLKYFD